MLERNQLLPVDVVSKSMDLKTGIQYMVSSNLEVYVVGEGIGPYLGKLRSFGFMDFWNSRKSNIDRLMKRGLKNYPDVCDDAKSMYSYVDFVLEDTNGILSIFLPTRGNFDTAIKGYTYYEVERAFHHMVSIPNRTVFIKGLFNMSPREFESAF